MKIEVNTTKAPAAVGPYTQAIQMDKLLFFSGQLGLNPKTGEMVEGLEAQTEQAFENVNAVLSEANLTMDDVLKVTVFLTDIADFEAVNEIYAKQFQQPYLARSAYAVAALPKDGLVEIEVIAGRK